MDDEVTTLAHKGELLSITDKWKLIDACLSIGIEVTSRHSKFKYAKLIYNYMQKEIRNTDVGRLIKEKYDKKEHKKAHREKKLRKLVAQTEQVMHIFSQSMSLIADLILLLIISYSTNMALSCSICINLSRNKLASIVVFPINPVTDEHSSVRMFRVSQILL